MPLDVPRDTLRATRRRVAALATAVVLSLVACTAGTPGAPQEPEPTAPPQSPDPLPSRRPADPLDVVLRVPEATTTVLTDGSAAQQGLLLTRALYDEAPVLVLVGADDVPGALTAATAAVALGVPALTVGDGVDLTDVTAEIGSLGTVAVLAVGPVPAPQDVDVVRVRSGASRALLETATGVVLGAEQVVAAGKEDAAVRRLEPGATAVLLAEEVAPTPAVPGDGPTTDPSATPTVEPSATVAPSASATVDPSDSAVGSASRVPLLDGATHPLPERARLPHLSPVAARDAVTLLSDAHRGRVPALTVARAARLPVVPVRGGDPRRDEPVVQALGAAPPSHVVALGSDFGSTALLAPRVAAAATGVQLPGGGQLVFPEGAGATGKRYVALYGTPGSAALGVLGEQDVPATVTRAKKRASSYRRLTDHTVVPMVEIIATIASAGAGDDGDYSRERPVAELRPLVDAAGEAGVAVVLDLQPGRTSFLAQAKRYEELLLLPHVGLALDPEWRLQDDQVHLRQIGSVGIGEVNDVGDWLAGLTRENALPQKMFVLHQFAGRMIRDRERLDVTHDELAVLIHVDGQGSQPAKQGTWAALRAGAPDVHWGWKNFYDEDSPMLSPKETYEVRPVPDLVTYQ